MKSSRILASAVLLLVSVALTAPAIGGAEFLGYGYAKYTPAPATLGATIEVYTIMDHPGGLDDPIFMDWTGTQYTAVVTGMPITVLNAAGWLLEETHGNGRIDIFADPVATGTAADFAVPGTFTDGTLILSAAVDPGFQTLMLDFDSDTLFSGSGHSGPTTFDGGTRLGDLMAAEYYLYNWVLSATIQDHLAAPSVQVPDGYDRLFDIKITTDHDPTPTVGTTWGDVRKLYR